MPVADREMDGEGAEGLEEAMDLVCSVVCKVVLKERPQDLQKTSSSVLLRRVCCHVETFDQCPVVLTSKEEKSAQPVLVSRFRSETLAEFLR